MTGAFAMRIATAGLLAGMLCACARGSEIAPGPVVATPDPALGQAAYSDAEPATPVLRPSDVISVMVFREPELSTERAVVAADGTISMPLLGTVRIAGRTPAEIERQMETLLDERYLRDPDVTVNVVDYVSHRVSVEGAVTEPGIYQFQPGTRLSGAIALANGLERTARPRDVAVFRQGEGGLEVARFDYSAISRGTMLDPVLVPGDRVVIGTDRLGQAWQDVLRALPAFGTFTQI